MRHAKSSWKDPRLEDHQRPLNKRGTRNVPVMGKRLSIRAIHLDRIVSSDARRAIDTAIPIGEYLGLDVSAILQNPLLYHATQEQILDIIRQLDSDWKQVMIVGHNPGLHDVANQFFATPISNFPTAGIVTLVFDIDTWQEIDQKRVIYSDFDFPKKQKLKPAIKGSRK
jgi:phosphohistidine phosphatase